MRNFFVKLLRYFFTGGIAAIVDAGGFSLLYQSGVLALPAAVSSFSIAAIVNFLLTSRFVFRQRATIRRFTLFLVAALFGLTVNVGVTMLTIMYLGLDPRLSKIVGIGTAFLINFLLNLCIVFRKNAVRHNL
jgi:putative flippase GtrA